ncbi:Serine/threonine protein kinase [Gracilaria domingensis]|nr:Serine/threonine protein kinase [Gracilaria domingensis]
MFKSLLKAAQSVERGIDSAFSSAPASHTAFKNLTLTIAGISVRLGSVFAEGGYSFIHVATPVSSNVPNGTRYAVKRLSCSEEEPRRQAHQEIEFLRKLPPHPNVVKFYDAVFHHGHAFLLFELADGGTLPEILSRSQLSSQRKLLVLADITAAIVHVHSQRPPVFVRDVKLENVLYDRLQHCYKLCDFGSATSCTWRPLSRADILAVEEDVANNCTSMYRAPEMVDLYSKPFICERADVWSLGCIWYALLFNSLPFDGSSSLQITKGLANIPTQPAYPDEFISLLRNMLVVDPAHRYDSFQVLEEVNLMLGRENDPQLMSVGSELRARRCVDFGIDSNATNAADCSNAALPLIDSAASAPSQPLSQSLLGDFDDLFVSENTHGKAACSVSESEAKPSSVSNQSWADFESAFEKPSTESTSNNVLTSSSSTLSSEWTKSTPSNMPHRAHSSTGSVTRQYRRTTQEKAFGRSAFGRVSELKPTATSTVPPYARIQQGNTAMPSLIDVSDLSGCPKVSGQPQASGQHSVVERRGGGTGSECGKAANFEDLIDFG